MHHNKHFPAFLLLVPESREEVPAGLVLVQLDRVASVLRQIVSEIVLGHVFHLAFKKLQKEDPKTMDPPTPDLSRRVL